jgi:hypothetical protein
MTNFHQFYNNQKNSLLMLLNKLSRKAKTSKCLTYPLMTHTISQKQLATAEEMAKLRSYCLDN